MANEQERDRVGLPPRIFMYTVDQLAMMLELDSDYIKMRLLFYDRRSPGVRPKEKILAHNIAPEGVTPEWRVTEKEFIRYLRIKGVKFYERGFAH